MKYKVVVSDCPSRWSTPQLKALRTAGKMTLRTAYDTANMLSRMRSATLLSGIDTNVAMAVQHELLKVGLQASVCKSDDNTPMLISVDAKHVYKWSAFHRLKSARRMPDKNGDTISPPESKER